METTIQNNLTKGKQFHVTGKKAIPENLNLGLRTSWVGRGCGLLFDLIMLGGGGRNPQSIDEKQPIGQVHGWQSSVSKVETG